MPMGWARSLGVSGLVLTKVRVADTVRTARNLNFSILGRKSQ